jgi:hypothetical protein
LVSDIEGRTVGICVQNAENIFGPKKDEITSGWRKLYNKELQYMYSSSNLIRMIKSRWTGWPGKVARMGRRGIFIGFWRESKKERKRPLGKPRHGLDDSIQIDIREIGWVVWTGFIWLRIETSVRIL